MAGVSEQYLMSKFQKGLEDSTSKIPMLTKFQEIEALLDKLLKSTQPVEQQDPSTQRVEQLDPSSIREKLYNLNDLLTECKTLSKKKRSFHSPQELLEINNIRIKLSKIKAELELAVPKNDKINLTQPKTGENSRRVNIITTTTTTFRSVDSSTIHGFNEQLVSLERLILQRDNNDDDRFKAIAIVGPEGVGKTTLCQMLFNQENVKNRFLPRVWVSMSRLFDEDYKKKGPKVAIAKRLLASLGVENEIIELVLEKNGLG